jgi:hypothetical protein
MQKPKLNKVALGLDLSKIKITSNAPRHINLSRHSSMDAGAEDCEANRM